MRLKHVLATSGRALSEFIGRRRRTRQVRGLWATALACLALPLGSARAQLLQEVAPPTEQPWLNLDIHGEISNRTGVRVQSPGDVSVTQTQAKLFIDVELTDRLSLRGETRARYEPELSPKPERELSQRELTLRYIDDAWTVTLGRQQVVWGTADKVRVLDIVNPLDLREFTLDGAVDSRLPLWMANVEYSFGEASLQMLVVPDFRPNRQAPPDGRFAITAPLGLAAGGVPVGVIPPGSRLSQAPGAERPADWEYGLRWRGRLGDADYSLNYLYGWTDDPVSTSFMTLGGPQIRADYRRQHLLGGSFEVPIGALVLRGELLLTPDFPVPASTAPGELTSEKRFGATGLLGLDWNWDGWSFGAQIARSQIFGTSTGTLIDDTAHLVTLGARRDFMQDRLAIALSASQQLSPFGTLLSASATYSASRWLSLEAGADIFAGARDSAFGQFEDESRIYERITVHF